VVVEAEAEEEAEEEVLILMVLDMLLDVLLVATLAVEVVPVLLLLMMMVTTTMAMVMVVLVLMTVLLAASTLYDRANFNNPLMSPASACFRALMYSSWAAAAETRFRLSGPHENGSRPPRATITSAQRRVWRPLPFGKGWIRTAS
jgi:hypothetical protein